MSDDHAYLIKVLETEKVKYDSKPQKRKFVSANQAIEMQVAKPESLKETTARWLAQMEKYKG
jgi:hypothetical protein